MWRRLRTAVTILCLLLCAASSVLWVRSHRPVASLQDQDSLTLTRRDPQYWFVSRGGKLVLCRQVGKDWDQPLPSFKLVGLGFGGGRGPGSMLWNLSLPYWLITSLTLLPPLAW